MPPRPVRYVVKEDWMYLSDGRGLVGRIIGIAPLAGGINEAGNFEEKPLFWLYYPEVRAHLRKQATGISTTRVANLDEWFETHRYASTITDVQDRSFFEMRRTRKEK
jgi:hypothetical protein